MLRLFSSNQSLVIFLLPLLFMGNILLNNYTDLFEGWRNFETNMWGIRFAIISPMVSSFFAVVLLSVIATIISFTFNQHEFFEKNTYLPSLIYAFLAMYFPFSIMLNGDLFAQLFLVLAINQILKIKQNEDARSHVFNSSFLVGISATFNPIYFGFLPFIWIALLSVRPFVFREFILVLIGIALPVLWTLIVNVSIFQMLFNEMAINETMLSVPYFSVVIHFLILVTFLISLRYIFERFNKSSIRFKRLFRIVFILLIYPILTGVILYYILGTDYFIGIGLSLLPLLLVYIYLDARVKILGAVLLYTLLSLNVLKFFI